MSLRKILWSILAGASMSLMGGCDEDKSPGDASTEDTGGEEAVFPDAVYYGPPDIAEVDTSDAVTEDGDEEEELTPVEYGPPSP